MESYRVKRGCELAHEGQVLRGGTDVTLPAHVAYEVRHLVDPIAGGKVVPWPSPAGTSLQEELEKSRPHERISILEQARARAAGDLTIIDQKIAEERKRLAETGEGPAPPKPAGRKADAPEA